MASNINLFEVFGVRAASWPSSYVSVEEVEGSCCALHRKIRCGVGGLPGCEGLPPGSHLSIRALYEDDRYVCHAEVGQRVLDRELFDQVIAMSDDFVRAAFRRTNRFRKRYMGGFPIGSLAYGAGFCYLDLVADTARSRVARCLGPLPLVADVVRFVFFVGDFFVNNLQIDEVKPGLFHVRRAMGQKDPSVYRILREMIAILEGNPHARVGMEGALQAGSFRELRGFLDGIDVEPVTGISFRMRLNGQCPGWMSSFPRIELTGNAFDVFRNGDRLDRLKAWFLSSGIKIPGEMEMFLLIATSATSVFPIGMKKVKDVVKLVAIVGDSVLKLVMSMSAFSQLLHVSEYVKMNCGAQNQNLAALMVESGLRECCQVDNLSATSKANADMFEAVVGVLAMYCSSEEVLQFLKHVGLVQNVKYDIDLEISGLLESAVRVEMNSEQHARAMKLCQLGLI